MYRQIVLLLPALTATTKNEPSAHAYNIEEPE